MNAPPRAPAAFFPVDSGRQKSHNNAVGIGAHAGQPFVMALRLDGQFFHFQQCKGGKSMKLFTGIFAVLLALVLSIGNVMAVPAGKVEYAGGGAGKVVFDAKTHADKGSKCADCHTKPKLFEMKKGANKMTMKEMVDGKFCGACHDGKKSFSSKEAADCAKCHKK